MTKPLTCHLAPTFLGVLLATLRKKQPKKHGASDCTLAFTKMLNKKWAIIELKMRLTFKNLI